MRKLILLSVLSLTTFSFVPANAQQANVCTTPGNAGKLYCIPILAVENLSAQPGNLTVEAGVPPAFSALNAAIGEQITQLPTPSPSSGIIFSFGPSGLVREQNLGPIFSERPSTVGRHKLYVAFTYQFFQFDQLDRVNLKQIPLQINGCGSGTIPGVTPGCGDAIETRSRLDLKLHQFTSYAAFGLTSRVDVSVAIPILDVRMAMQAGCVVCSQAVGGLSLIFNPNGKVSSASGIGDVTFRVKALVWNGERAKLGVGTDIRTPTGDDLNLLGSGTVGVRPFAAFSYRASSRISPHANIGYEWNGNSILAATANVAKHLPNSLTYNAGVDLSVVRPFELVFDFLGQTFIDAERVILGQRAPLNHPDTACSLTSSGICQLQTLNTNSFSVGAKYNPAGNFLITASVLFKLDHNGLHYKPAPMIGISYTF